MISVGIHVAGGNPDDCPLRSDLQCLFYHNSQDLLPVVLARSEMDGR